jgi:hypothetical protein
MQPTGVYRAKAAMKQVLEHYEFDTVLDIGAGYGLHTSTFREFGKIVTPTDLFGRIEGLVIGNYMDLEFEPHDITWASHVLEHQLDTHSFLKKLRKETKVGGYACITVPPMKHNIVGGHVSLWNAGLLMYRMVLAGFDCKEAAIKKYGYNITVIARAAEFELPNDLEFGSGDIEKLSTWLPPFAKQGFNGNIQDFNWNPVQHDDYEKVFGKIVASV